MPAIVAGALLAVSVALAIVFRSPALAGGGLVFLGGLFWLWLVKGKSPSGLMMLGLITLLAGVLILRTPLQDISRSAQNRRYLRSLHAGIEDILSATGKHGDRYVVYDRERGELLSSCLPGELRARSMEELGGVFIVDTEAREVGYYSGKDTAYRYSQTIALRSAADGEVLGQKTIYGGDPPKVITVDALLDIFRFWNRTHYGKRPTGKDIAAACLELLNQNGEQGDS